MYKSPFRIGDYVVGKKGVDYEHEYSITTAREGFIGMVIDIDEADYENIQVRVVSTSSNKYIGECYWVSSDFFVWEKNNFQTLKALGGNIKC